MAFGQGLCCGFPSLLASSIVDPFYYSFFIAVVLVAVIISCNHRFWTCQRLVQANGFLALFFVVLANELAVLVYVVRSQISLAHISLPNALAPSLEMSVGTCQQNWYQKRHRRWCCVWMILAGTSLRMMDNTTSHCPCQGHHTVPLATMLGSYNGLSDICQNQRPCISLTWSVIL